MNASHVRAAAHCYGHETSIRESRSSLGVRAFDPRARLFALAARNIPRVEAAPEPTPGRCAIYTIILPRRRRRRRRSRRVNGSRGQQLRMPSPRVHIDLPHDGTGTQLGLTAAQRSLRRPAPTFQTAIATPSRRRRPCRRVPRARYRMRRHTLSSRDAARRRTA